MPCRTCRLGVDGEDVRRPGDRHDQERAVRYERTIAPRSTYAMNACSRTSSSCLSLVLSAMAVEKPAPRVLGHLQQRIDAHTEPQYGHAGCAALQQLAHKWARKCREQALKYWYGSKNCSSPILIKSVKN
jgi:hypothetical protein